MKFVSSLKMRGIDRLASERFGIPSLILMENAGRSVASEAEKMFKNKLSSIAIICGYGNNGGDGFVAGRHLVNKGYKVNIYLVGKSKKMSDSTKINFNILNKMKIKIRKINRQGQILSLARMLKKAQLIIDAIFGIGIKGELDKFYCQLIQAINNFRVPILSVDIPSGLDADRGVALPVAIKAKKTVTMGLMKKGFLNTVAKKFLGKVVIGNISLPKQLR